MTRIQRERRAAARRSFARAERFKKHGSKPVISYAAPASQFGFAIKHVDAETRALIDAAIEHLRAAR